jgi:hypothetical protein
VISQRYLRQTVAVQLTELGSFNMKIRIIFAKVVGAYDRLFGISDIAKLTKDVMKATDKRTLNKIFY